MAILFFTLLFIVFYAYVGYGIFIYVWNLAFSSTPKRLPNSKELPEVTILVAAYNEADYLEEKIENSLNQQYPEEKLNLVIVTDGSDDGSEQILNTNKRFKTFHSPIRQGKMAAIDRVMPFINSEIVIFTDANALLNQSAVIEIVKHFTDPQVGVVAGEKRIAKIDGATAERGEGAYWKYESFLKRQDAKFYSTIGAAGELFAIRREAFVSLEPDTLLDDFMLSLKICEKGFKIAYEPAAYALEYSSANTKEELKRKVRIAAGGIQSIARLKKIANPFHNAKLSFQYLSHRVLRWTAVPWILILLFLMNFSLITTSSAFPVLLVAQVLFYLLAFIGYLSESLNIKIGAFSIPYYFTMMNYAAIAGQFRYFNQSQSVLWERSVRKA